MAQPNTQPSDEAQGQEAEARSLVFLASIPQIQSAIKFGGDGSARVQLDVPASETPNMVPLVALTDRVLKVTVEVAAKSDDAQTLTDLDDETEEGAERKRPRLDLRRHRNRRDQSAGG